MTRTVSFRYVIMRSGADYTEIYPTVDSTPVVRMDDSGEIKTSFSGVFQDPGDEVDWLTDQIRPEMVLDGMTYPLGIYLPATVMYAENETTKTVQIEAYDRCWQVKALCTEDQKYFAGELNYLSAVGSLLSEAGIDSVSEDKTDLTLMEGREDWNIGTPALDIVNQLLGEINYKQLWFDANGTAMLQAERLPRAENISHTLDDTKIESMLIPQIQRQTDTYSAPNVFICVCSNADKDEPMIAMAENTNPQSPLSIARRRRRITQVVQLNNIASQDELQSYANRLVSSSMMRGETIQVETALLPGFGVGEVVALRYGELMTLTIERSWTMNLTVGGRMQHTLEKVVMSVE